MANRSMTSQPRLQPLDRTAWLIMVVLAAVIGLLWLSGDHATPRVRDFSWGDKQVGAEDTAFILTFSRPMDHDSVETNLRLEPPLPGKFSWAGRRMAYTLENPAPYGTEFELQLQGARDRFSEPGEENPVIQPFQSNFQTRDRAFVYLGVEGEEEGRLVLYNLTRQEQQILTPKNLVVMDFEPFPKGDRILFSATDPTSSAEGMLNQQIYTVTTGIRVESPASAPGEQTTSGWGSLFRRQTAPAAEPGQIDRVLDSQAYQNLKFDLAADGETIVVQRVNRENPAEVGLWMIKLGEPPQPIAAEPGGDFLVAPDSNTLAIAQGQGLAILPLEAQAEPLDFLPKFGMILSFARDGSAAATVKFNAEPGNPTRSLFLVTNQGQEEELLETTGSVLHAQFDPTNRYLYCLVTKLLPVEEYVEQPYLVVVDTKTKEVTELLILPIQRDIQISLSPDGLGILFDQVVSDPEDASGTIRGTDGKAIASSRLWFLPALFEDEQPLQPDPEPLPIAGLRPRWLP